MNKICLFFILSVLVFSCNKDRAEMEIIQVNSKGEISYLPYIWTSPYIEDGNWLNYTPNIIGNWVFEEKAILSVRKLDNSFNLKSIDIQTGEEQWSWQDFHNDPESITGRFFSKQDNVLHWKSSNKQYWLDLHSGTTIKKNIGNQIFGIESRSLGDTNYSLGIVKDSFPGIMIQSLFKGSFYDENPKLILMPEIDENNIFIDRASDITSIYPYTEGLDTLLVVAWQKVFEDWNFQSYLGLYNLSKKDWIYNKVPIGEIDRKGFLYQPLKKYKNTVITNVGNNLVCYNYSNGEKVWVREFSHDFLSSGFEISGDILVANCENKNLYGIDPNNGNIIWTSEGAGTSSLLQNRVLNGVVYFTGGSTGYFHAVDIQSGKILWKLDPLKYEENNGYWSTGTVLVSSFGGDRGRIIIQNATNYYSFEAI